MKIRNHVLKTLPVLALALGILGCSREKKEADSLINEVVTKPESQDQGPRSIAYFTSWSLYDNGLSFKDIDPSLLTHVNFAFAYLDVNGEILVGDQDADVNLYLEPGLSGNEEGTYGHFGQLKLFKEKYPEVKVLISVGGWSWSTNFSDVAADPKKRDRFAASAAEFISKYDFDGIDIDWEYPVEGGNGITHRSEDNVNFELLMKATRKALNELGETNGKTYLISVAARAAGRFVNDANLIESMQYIDYINLMTYDYHGSWENKTDFNTPLYDLQGGPSIDESVRAFLNAGIHPADINLGLAFYGKGWINVTSTDNNGTHQLAEVPNNFGYGLGTYEPASFQVWDILQNYVDKNGYVRYYDETAQCPYVFNGSNWITYDDEQSIKAKTMYAMEKDLGGVMFWDFSGDYDYALQKTIAETLDLKK